MDGSCRILSSSKKSTSPRIVMWENKSNSHGKTESNFTILDQIFRPDLSTVNANITEELQDISTNLLMSSTNI
jgi:hypothetical protein